LLFGLSFHIVEVAYFCEISPWEKVANVSVSKYLKVLDRSMMSSMNA
jgi:hypothetical protein